MCLEIPWQAACLEAAFFPQVRTAFLNNPKSSFLVQFKKKLQNQTQSETKFYFHYMMLPVHPRDNFKQVTAPRSDEYHFV
jgi:hypothetical protein